MDILNNREIAIALWFLVISIYIFSASKMAEVRSSFKRVLAALFNRKIMTVLCLMVVYMAIIISWLSELALWNFEQLKNTIFWFVSVGFLSLFKLEKIKQDKHFFKHSVLGSLKLLAILQFVVGVYTFPLWLEVLLAPALALLGIMLTIAETDKKYHQVRIFLEYFLSFFGIILVLYTLYMLMTDFGEFGKEKTAYDFFVPPLLTLSYLPFVFFMLIYSTYEQAFYRLKFSVRNRSYRYAAMVYAFIIFNVRINALKRWSFHVSGENIRSHSDLIDTFKYIFEIEHSEKNPKEVPKEQGWSPYKAKEFLVNEGLSTGFYNKSFKEEWSASSPMKEFGDGIIPNNIAYSVEGSKDVAKILKLNVNVNNASKSRQACERLETMAEALSISSLNLPLSDDMRSAISGCNSHSEKVDGKTITLVVEHWPNRKFNGFGLKLLISSI